ncbi:MAG: hypothetical protein ACOYMD_02255 [Paludibacter sp.]
MKTLNHIFILVLILISLISCKSQDEPPVPFVPVTSDLPEYRNFFGVSWNGLGNISENLAYAKQMGYGYVFYMTGMEKDPLSDNLYFFIESPQANSYSRTVNTTSNYNSTQIDFYNNYCALKSSDPFPNNLATGWFTSATSFSVALDLQQKKVIDWVVADILAKVKAIENVNPKFHFGGYSWDVPDLVGDFWNKDKAVGGLPTTLKFWTGGDYGVIYGNNVHNYATYSDGSAEFYKALFAATKVKYPNFKTIYEPYSIYDQWISKVKDRPDAKLIMPDILTQENREVTFLDDSRIFATYGTAPLIDKEHVASTAPANFTEQANRVNAAKLAMNKSWFNWFGRVGGTGDMPVYGSMKDVPARLKLIRVLPNWENINVTPISSRTWNGVVYKSPNAYASDSAISVIQPKTGKQFIVFLKSTAVVDLPAGKTVKSISLTDGLFREATDAKADFIITTDKIKPTASAVLDQCYIVNY